MTIDPLKVTLSLDPLKVTLSLDPLKVTLSIDLEGNIVNRSLKVTVSKDPCR